MLHVGHGASLRSIAAAEVPVVYLPGPAPRYASPLDFTRTPALIEDAYNAARVFLQTVTIDGPGLYRAPSS